MTAAAAGRGRGSGVGDWRPWGLALLAAMCVVLAIEPWPVGVFQDDGVYAVLAKSLATGEGYRFIQMPGAPHATHYPPGYPLFLAALWKVYPRFPENVTLFKFANAALLGAAAFGAYRFAITWARLGKWGAASIVALFTACTPVVLLSVMLLSEPLFLVGLLPALWAAERAAHSGGTRDAAWAGAAAGALSMVRSLGILVAPATALVLVWRRQWRSAAVTLGVAGLVMLPWQAWVSAYAHEVPPILLGKYGSYTGWLADAVRAEGPLWVLKVGWFNLGKLVFETWTHTATVLLPVGIRVAATAAVCALLIAGFVVAFRRIQATALFVLMYLAVVVIWPFAPARFVWGIWPLIGMLLGLGAQALVVRGVAFGSLGRSPAHPLARAVWATATACLLVGYLTFNYQSIAEKWWAQVQGSVAMRAKPMAEWVNANTRQDAVLATDDDLLVYLYTGRRTVPNAAFTAQEHVIQIF